jgi:hypothetical protein
VNGRYLCKRDARIRRVSTFSRHCRSGRPDRKRSRSGGGVARPSGQSLKPRLLTAEGTLDGGRRSTTWGCPARVCARRSRSPTFGEKPIDSRPALLVDLPQAQEETEPAPLTRVRGDADDRRRADPGHGSSQRRRRVPFSQPTASGCLDTWATRCVSGCISAISLVSFVRIAGSKSPTSATSITNAPAPPITQSW